MATYGLIGEKLGHSLSPEIHTKLFQLLNIKGSYGIFEISREHLHNAVNSLKTLNIKGCNVTIPYKEEIMKQLDEISPKGKNIGAINTIYIKDGKALGDNTDYYGFGLMLQRFNVEVKNKVAVVLGAGGAAKAVIEYLVDNEASEIILVSRDKAAAEKKFPTLKVMNYEELKSLNLGHVIINTTPCGMYPNVGVSAVDKAVIAKFKVAVDLIFNPDKPLFLQWAEELGLQSINGLYMLVGQAIKAEELWNEIEIPNHITEEIYNYVKGILGENK